MFEIVYDTLKKYVCIGETGFTIIKTKFAKSKIHISKHKITKDNITIINIEYTKQNKT